MAQPQHDPIPSSYPLTLVPPTPPNLQSLRARRRLLARGIKAISLCALLAVAYLCCLVRVMQIDAACKTKLEDCRRKEAEVGGLAIRLSAVTDARRIERFAEESGLVCPQRVDEITVSPELCLDDTRLPSRQNGGELLAANLGSDSGSLPGP